MRGLLAVAAATLVLGAGCGADEVKFDEGAVRTYVAEHNLVSDPAKVDELVALMRKACLEYDDMTYSFHVADLQKPENYDLMMVAISGCRKRWQTTASKLASS